MNATIARALFFDALYQVLDNKVFRILAVLVGVIVLFSFLVGFREQEITILFGAWKVSYASITGNFGMPPNPEAQKQVIAGAVALVLDALAGSLGLTIAIAATAFFLPRVLEKGAADLVFSKPISRLWLLLTQYAAGLLFIGSLSLVLVGGVWLGLLVNSRYNDPGILWSALTMVMVFGVLHAVSMLFGLFTRNTIAATLLTLVFMFANSCVHSVWVFRGFYEYQLGIGLDAPDEDEDAQALAADGAEAKESGLKTFERNFFRVIAVLHYALPKTNEAEALTRKLRAQVSGTGPVFYDAASFLTLDQVPDGALRVDPLDAEAPRKLMGSFEPGRPLVQFQGSDDAERATLWILSREQAASKHKRSLSDLGKEAEAALRAIPGVGLVEAARSDVGNADARRLRCLQPGAGAGHELILYLVLRRDEFVVLTYDCPAASADNSGNASERARKWARAIEFRDPNMFRNPVEWHEEQLGWNAEPRYNLYLSLGSTLLFTLAALALGWRKIARMEF